MTPLLAWLMMVVVGYAAPADAVPADAAPADAAPIDAAALERMLDQTVPARMEATGAPGVLVTVVQGDRVVLTRGWGWADVEHRIPMDPERTIFRVASISKVFTATAVAQLEQAGQVSLDAPVDNYLPGLVVPPLHAEPVTLRHLLSHTGGFINNNIDRASTAPPTEGLAAFMARTMPPQVHPPGRVVIYSNHGNALAGLVVQEVSGQPFERTMHDQILQPLRMHDSAFGLDPTWGDRVATGYMVEDGVARPAETLYVKTTPASGLLTTAADIARFMMLHLGDGSVDGQRVLHPAALERMRTPVPAIHPALPGFHYGFAHGTVAGHPMRRHGGSVPGFLSRLVLFDGHGVGIFVGHNAFGIGLRDALVEAIAREVLPEPPPPPAVVPADDGRPRDPAALVGTYHPASLTDTPGFMRPVMALQQTPLRVALDPEGFLTVDGQRFVRTGERVFHRAREAKPPQVVVFVADEGGTIRWIHRDGNSAVRRPWHASPWVQGSLYGSALLILLLASVGGHGPIRRWAHRPPRLAIAAARLALLGAVVPVLYALWVDHGQPPLMRPLRFGAPGWLTLMRWLVPLGAVLAVIAVVRGRRDGEHAPDAGRGPGRRTAVVIAVAIAGLLLLSLYWSTADPGLARV